MISTVCLTLGAPLRALRRLVRSQDATAGMEFALVLPAMVALTLGTMDLGAALVLNRKLISATNTMADQATRYSALDADALLEIQRSGEIILRPHPIATLGADLVSVEYDADGEPAVLCRLTQNMPPDGRFPDGLQGLAGWREGAIGLSTQYEYQPRWWGFASGPITLDHFMVARPRTGRAVRCV